MITCKENEMQDEETTEEEYDYTNEEPLDEEFIEDEDDDIDYCD